ncbi:MAG: hypothetical protein IKT74_02725 [Bacteroidales bacterium]|nr:hypothetical protein [Bacteroidales bacterium]
MKILKYLAYSLVLGLMLASCTKHEILPPTDPAQNAEFQLHYFEPVVNQASNYIDSVFVNGILYSSVNGSGQLTPYNGVPGGSTGRFFSVAAGEVNFKFYRKDQVVYDKTCTLNPGKQNVIVHDMNLAPIVLDNQFPYPHTSKWTPGSIYTTDSISSIKFINLLYEAPGQPYDGALQYQWKHPRTKEWINLGTPVRFGEATNREIITIVKEVYNSSGYCRIDYRILDENGDILQVRNSSGKMVDYSDYWTGYIGQAKMHFFRGFRTVEPRCNVSQWGSL